MSVRQELTNELKIVTNQGGYVEDSHNVGQHVEESEIRDSESLVPLISKSGTRGVLVVVLMRRTSCLFS